jgi:hypothetical protein
VTAVNALVAGGLRRNVALAAAIPVALFGRMVLLAATAERICETTCEFGEDFLGRCDDFLVGFFDLLKTALIVVGVPPRLACGFGRTGYFW